MSGVFGLRSGNHQPKADSRADGKAEAVSLRPASIMGPAAIPGIMSGIFYEACKTTPRDLGPHHPEAAEIDACGLLSCSMPGSVCLVTINAGVLRWAVR
jgi:hypothetical protein